MSINVPSNDPANEISALGDVELPDALAAAIIACTAPDAIENAARWLCGQSVSRADAEYVIGDEVSRTRIRQDPRFVAAAIDRGYAPAPPKKWDVADDEWTVEQCFTALAEQAVTPASLARRIGAMSGAVQDGPDQWDILSDVIEQWERNPVTFDPAMNDTVGDAFLDAYDTAHDHAFPPPVETDQFANLSPGARALLAKAQAATTSKAKLEPLVAGLLDKNTIARIIGKTNHGKTFLSIDLACCVAAGKPWNGRAVQQGPVVVMVGEGQDGWKLRRRAWERHYNGGEEIPMPQLLMLDEPIQVDDEDGWSEFVEVCAAVDASFVVIDTQSAVSTHLNENNSEDMKLLVSRVNDLRRETGACVLLNHHIGLTGDHGRGHTVVIDATTTELRIASDKSGVDMTVTASKQRDAVKFDPMSLRMHSVPTDDRDHPTTAVLVPVGEAHTTATGKATWRDAELPAALLSVHRFTSGGRSVIHDLARWMVHNGTAATAAEARRGIGIDGRGAAGGSTARYAWEALIDGQWIAPVDGGSYVWKECANRVANS